MARASYPLTVSEIRPETADTVSIAFDVPPEVRDAFRFAPGQFLTFRVPDADGHTVQRSYSICSSPDDGELRVAVKRLAGGLFGERAHTTMQVGDTIDALSPTGRFTADIDPEGERSFLFLAAGSGIAPVMSLLRTILGNEQQSRATLVYGNRTHRDTIFFEALNDLKDRYLPRFQLIHVFSREHQIADLLNGRITPEKVRELGKELLDLTSFDEVFVCGPEPMTLDLRAALIGMGLDEHHVHVELYGSHVPKSAAIVGDEDGSVRIDVTLAGVTRSITGRRSDSILDAATEAGLDVPFSCTGGVCATCRAHLRSGKVEMAANYALEPWELDAGFVLTCQGRPTTDAVSVDYDAV
jgi:ring-1,2-phenylacetyl-CoA epoxidase subunit PaaE